MPPLPFIDPSTYTPGSFPYVDDGSQPVDRATWLAIFYESIPYFSDMARADTSVEDAEVKAGTFASTYREWLDGLASSPLDPSVKYSCLYLCKLREEALRKAGFRDIFRQIKVTENGNALKLLRGVCKELDALTDGSGVASEGVTANGVTSNGVAANGTTGQMIEKQETAWATVIRNILAGNIFDCGTAATRGDVFCFERSRSKLADRPWIVDDLDLFVRTMMTKTYRKALLFCDNSGPDFCLGMLPFARQLLKTNTAASVVIAANTHPSLNDITYDDIMELLPDIFREDDILKRLVDSKRLRFVPSGSDLPVIDLSGEQNTLSPELLEEATDADFVVLEGMGRSIETNLYAKLVGVDSLRIGMVKHVEVATCLGTKLKDCLVKFAISNP